MKYHKLTPREIRALKEVKNIKMFNGMTYNNDYADICRCNHCQNNVLVPVTATYCPICGEELSWIENLENEGIYEVDVNQLNSFNKVEVVEPKFTNIFE